MTSEVALRRILKQIPEAAQNLIVVAWVAHQHGTKLLDEGEVYDISALGMEMAELLLREDKWKAVADAARKDILGHEIVH